MNQEFQIPFEINFDVENTDFGGCEGIINLTTTEDEDFPIKIPIYNVGVGMAQNCKVVWSTQNQKEVALQCRKLFQYSGLEPYSAEDIFF